LPERIFLLWKKIFNQTKIEQKLEDIKKDIESAIVELMSTFIENLVENPDKFYQDTIYTKSKKFKKSIIRYYGTFFDLYLMGPLSIAKKIN